METWWSNNPRYSKTELSELCKTGIKSVQAGYHNSLRFNVFNKYEADYIYEFMQQEAPEIKFTIHRTY